MNIFIRVKIALFLLLLIIGIVACSEDTISTQKDFNFEVYVQKHRKEIPINQSSDFVIILDRKGNYSGTSHTVTYFLREGEGLLMQNGNSAILDNKPYLIVGDTIYINYTPRSQGSHVIEAEFRDSFNNSKELIIELNTKK
jgi:hypothetical protein